MTTGRINQVCPLHVWATSQAQQAPKGLRPMNSSSTQRASVSKAERNPLCTTPCTLPMQGCCISLLLTPDMRMGGLESAQRSNPKPTHPHFCMVGPCEQFRNDSNQIPGTPSTSTRPSGFIEPGLHVSQLPSRQTRHMQPTAGRETTPVSPLPPM